MAVTFKIVYLISPSLSQAEDRTEGGDLCLSLPRALCQRHTSGRHKKFFDQ